MILDVYQPKETKEGKIAPGVVPSPMEWSDIKSKVCDSQYTKEKVEEYRKTGNKELKDMLPSICFVGACSSTRAKANMTPTQLVMIDVDHCKDKGIDVKDAWGQIDFKLMGSEEMAEWKNKNIILAHITPSFGLRIVFVAQPDFKTLEENMKWFAEEFELAKYGDVDFPCKDFSRISFLVPSENFLYESAMLYTNSLPWFADKNFLTNGGTETKEEKAAKSNVPELTEEQMKMYDEIEFRGIRVKDIIDKYIEVYGEPTSGEIHNFYNELIKNFRCITDNNKKALLHLLPRFGHTAEECWSQIVSICRVNTLSKLDRDFYFFLKNNGFYNLRSGAKGSQLREYMMSDVEQEELNLPYLPPVFREFIKCCPKDFVVPAINALMPILGTLTSYVKAIYPYDAREHTTSFFSIIFAPPGTGKGFVSRYIDILLEDLKVRDFISQARENIFLNVVNKKGANEKAPDNPHVSLRIIPPKNSEAEFLQKQADNKGYHMFTYAAEMDSWAKGVKAAGGNKDDMVRVAWDNDEYGQQFKSTNTFKGIVRLYWNVLITGTPNQIDAYFKNVENGLVTRCCFTPIENQEFVLAPKWKTLSVKELNTIKAFVKRCDENTYKQPCTTRPEDLACISEDIETFDKEVDWHFEFNERKLVDMDWIMPTIDKFQVEQMNIGLKDVDKARDVFRRRVGVRGFRLALLCTCLYKQPRKTDLEKCKEFVWWWMHQDMDNMLKLWGAKYNEQSDATPNLTQRKVFDQLSEEFTTSDMYAICVRQGIKTPIRNIIYGWRKQGFVDKLEKDRYKKLIHNS